MVRPSHADEAADNTHSLRFAAYERAALPAQPAAPLLPAVQQPSPGRGSPLVSTAFIQCSVCDLGFPPDVHDILSVSRLRPRVLHHVYRVWAELLFVFGFEGL